MPKITDVYQKGYAKIDPKTLDYRLQKVLDIIYKHRISANNILDFGCGDGGFSLVLQERLGSKDVYGLDISSEAIEKANERGIHAQVSQDGVDWNFEDEYFDFIYCGNVIELALFPDHIMKELYRVLSPNGFCIITHPNMCSWASRIAVLFGYLPFYYRISREYDGMGKLFSIISKAPSTGFIRLFNLNAFKQFVSLYHFEVSGVYGVAEKNLKFPLNKLDNLLSKRSSLAFQLIYILNKTTKK